jgi:hypothetical protein
MTSYYFLFIFSIWIGLSNVCLYLSHIQRTYQNPNKSNFKLYATRNLVIFSVLFFLCVHGRSHNFHEQPEVGGGGSEFVHELRFKPHKITFVIYRRILRIK